MITRLNRGGPLRQLQAIVPGLAARGIDGPVLVGAVPDGEDDGTADLLATGARVVRVPGLSRGIDPAADARALDFLVAYLRRMRPDVVHTHTAKAGAIGRVAALLARVPLVVHTFHGHHFDAGGVAGLAARFAERRLARLTSRAICLSARQRDDVVERHRIVPAARVVVIGPVIDVPAFRSRATADACEAWRARHAQPDETVLLWLGRHTPVKDSLGLIEAFARASRSRPSLRLWLAGDGPLRVEVNARVSALGIGAHVSDVGPVADSAPVVGACDALVLSSRSEGTPIAILEAQALGRFVVATAVGGVPDLVPAGGPGALVPPGDAEALAHAMTSVVRRTGPGSDARFPRETLVERWDRPIDRLAALYRGEGAAPSSGARRRPLAK